MLSGLFVQLHADEIRHTAFPNVMLGTWAETAEQCAASAKPKALVNAGEFLGSSACGQHIRHRSRVLRVRTGRQGQLEGTIDRFTEFRCREMAA